MRRLPAIEREIGKIRDDDFRVKILGVIVDRDETNQCALIDDGSGKAVLYFMSRENFDMAREGKVVRVIGKVRREENIEIDVEIIQDMSNLDLALYEQVRYVLNEGG
ncbi:MAG: replication protein RepA [Thermoplasmata archaeon]|nr:MAG: replication protein RepA [Thermoplasmata archaeon]